MADSCQLVLKRIHGNYCKTGERRAEAEVQLPQAQPVQAVRAAARISAQVRHLPFVLPGTGSEGRDSGCCEVELVERQGSGNSGQLVRE